MGMVTFGKDVLGRGFPVVQPDSGYPKYFGYTPQMGGISEPGSDTNKLGEINRNHSLIGGGKKLIYNTLLIL